MIATSFRLLDGRVRNLTGHFDRLGLTPTQREEVRLWLRQQPGPASNPIIWADAQAWQAQLRPDRLIKPLIVADAHAHLDERRVPQIKGPDLMWLSTRMNVTKGRGADEGLLKDAQGRIIEGIFSTLLALRGTEVAVSTHPRALASVTAAQVVPYLKSRGMRVVERPDGFGAQELHEAEVWSLNAFSGVRVVEAWAEYGTIMPVPAGQATRAHVPTADELNSWLWENAELV